MGNRSSSIFRILLLNMSKVSDSDKFQFQIRSPWCCIKVQPFTYNWNNRIRFCGKIVTMVRSGQNVVSNVCSFIIVNSLRTKPTKLSNTLKQLVWVCLMILWAERLKGYLWIFQWHVRRPKPKGETLYKKVYFQKHKKRYGWQHAENSSCKCNMT